MTASHSSLDHFSPDYGTARERFRTRAEARGARCSTHPIRARSGTGQELSIDVAYLGPEEPACVLALSSGLHGVEGFAGSAIQHQLLDQQLDGLETPEGFGMLLVHSLNPFGFDAIRRVNESNVDLNRNFLSHPDGHVPNPDYEDLYEAINPTRMDDPEADALLVGRLLAFGQEHGIARLQAALTVGQYLHPEGLQFGGQRDEESNRLLREIAATATRGAPRIAWIDFHTGLGPFGQVEMISESAPEAVDFVRARAWWGDCVQSTITGDSHSSAVHGSIEMGLSEVLDDRELTAVAAEFGTHDPVRVATAIRADNWLHQHGDPDSEQGRTIKRELLEVFRPDDRGWEASILAIGARLIEEACAGLRG